MVSRNVVLLYVLYYICFSVPLVRHGLGCPHASGWRLGCTERSTCLYFLFRVYLSACSFFSPAYVGPVFHVSVHVHVSFSPFFSPVPSRRNASAVSRRPRTSRPRPRRAIGACWIDRDWRRHTCPACSIAPLHVTCHVVQRARGQALLLSRCTGAALCVPRIISLLYLCPLRSLVWRSSGPVALPCLSLLSRGAPSTCSPPWLNWSCPV